MRSIHFDLCGCSLVSVDLLFSVVLQFTMPYDVMLNSPKLSP